MERRILRFWRSVWPSPDRFCVRPSSGFFALLRPEPLFAVYSLAYFSSSSDIVRFLAKSLAACSAGVARRTALAGPMRRSAEFQWVLMELSERPGILRAGGWREMLPGRLGL